MPALAVLGQLPAEYVVLESPRAVLALHRRFEQVFRDAGYGPDADAPSRPSDLAGRRPLIELRLGGQRFVVRRFTHGGLLRRVTGSRFLDAERPFSEIVLAQALERLRIPTPLIVAARARKMRPAGWALEVVTRRVEGAVDLTAALVRMGAEGRPGRLRTRLLRGAGRFVRRMHEAGFLHADLTPRNLLVEEASLLDEAPRFWVLDLDRSEVTGRLDHERRVENLARMLRHVGRSDHREHLRLRLTDLRRFLEGYEPSGRWKTLWREVAQRERSGRWLHEVGRILDRRPG